MRLYDARSIAIPARSRRAAVSIQVRLSASGRDPTLWRASCSLVLPSMRPLNGRIALAARMASEMAAFVRNSAIPPVPALRGSPSPGTQANSPGAHPRPSPRLSFDRRGSPGRSAPSRRSCCCGQRRRVPNRHAVLRHHHVSVATAAETVSSRGLPKRSKPSTSKETRWRSSTTARPTPRSPRR